MTAVTKEASKTPKVLLSFAVMLVSGIVIVLLAMATASILKLWNPLFKFPIKMLEYLGYIGWCATLGMRGWDIQTWDGKTFPERLNGWLSKAFSAIGIFSFVLARELVSCD